MVKFAKSTAFEVARCYVPELITRCQEQGIIIGLNAQGRIVRVVVKNQEEAAFLATLWDVMATKN